MSIKEVLREMRNYTSPSHPLQMAWADAIEAAMREPVAKVVTTQTGPEIVRLKDCPLGTRLYALPPDAQAEIERLKADAESCRKDAERMREALAMIATATTEDGCTCDNGYTPMWVAEEALAGKEDV
jgi:hypothetical protein